jgi:hypothetical protein
VPGLAVEGRQPDDLADVRRADVEVLLEAFEGVRQRVGNDDPTESPSRHAEVLREAVDDNGAGRMRERGGGSLAVVDAVVDLVADQLDRSVAAVPGERGESSVVEDRSCRVRGRGDDQAVEVSGVGERLRSGRPTRFRADGDRYRLHTERQ